jgi:selenide,water dikinase
MALASGLAAQVVADEVPLLPGVQDLLDGGFVPGGTARNVEFVSPHLDGGSDDERIVLADSQTSGGLIISLSPDQADSALAQLAASGHIAAVIGELVDGDAGHITLS